MRALTPLYVETRVLSGLGDGLACAEVCHDALVDLSRKEARGRRVSTVFRAMLVRSTYARHRIRHGKRRTAALA